MSKDSRDLIERGNYSRSTLSVAVFVGLRLLDGFVIQRALQVLDPMPSLVTKLGFTAPAPPPTGGLPLAMSDHALTPFQAVIWGMSIGSALKQSFAILFTTREKFPTSAAITVAVFNTISNGLNTLAFSLASMNPLWSETMFLTAIPLYASGILIEVISEVQRKRFKDDPKNQGKPFSGGLFGYARSINYFGYWVWRTSFAVAGGGLILGSLVAAMHFFDFTKRAIPIMDDYCSKRYGVQWTELKKKVPYAFFPGVC